MKRIKFRSLTAFAVAFISTVGLFSASVEAKRKATAADIVTTEQCGGLGQPICQNSAAIKISPVKNPKPTSRAFVVKRKGGEWWECPADHPHRRKLKPIDGPKACNSSDKGKGKPAHAKFLGKVDVEKPDKRAVRAKDHWWKCPEGFKRNLNPIEGPRACDTPGLKHCQKGLVAIGLPFTKNRTCEKRGVCGQLGQRPCTVTEHIPACKGKNNKAAVFLRKCVTREVHACLTKVRIAQLSYSIGDKVKEAKDNFEKGVLHMQEEVGKAFPAFKKVLELKKSKFTDRTSEAHSILFPDDKAGEANLISIVKQANAWNSFAPQLEKMHAAVTKNKAAIRAYFTDPKVCTQTRAERDRALGELLGFTPTLKKTEMIPPKWWEEILVKSAHASVGGDRAYVTIGISITATKFVGGVFDFYMATNFKDSSGFYIGLGAGIQSQASGKKLDFGLSIPIGLVSADDLDDIAGWGLTLGATAYELVGKKVGTDLPIGLGLDFVLNPPKKGEKVSLQGVAFTGKIPSKPVKALIEINAFTTHDWRIGTRKKDRK